MFTVKKQLIFYLCIILIWNFHFCDGAPFTYPDEFLKVKNVSKVPSNLTGNSKYLAFK